MQSYTVLGCTNEGAALCRKCCPLPEAKCEENHGAIFADSEWDCNPPTCDVCLERIEGVQIVHYPKNHESTFNGVLVLTPRCEYCNVTVRS